MKVLFLDIDGVLNSHAWWKRRICDSDRDDLDPAAVGLLNQILVRTKAKVVISSTWRLKGQEMVEKKLRAKGFIGEIIGMTEFLNIQRGYEIASWLVQNPQVKTFVILDDDSDMGNFSSHHVKTDFSIGLTQDLSDKAVQMLNGKVN